MSEYADLLATQARLVSERRSVSEALTATYQQRHSAWVSGETDLGHYDMRTEDLFDRRQDLDNRLAHNILSVVRLMERLFPGADDIQHDELIESLTYAVSNIGG